MAKDMDMQGHGEGCMCGGLWGHHHWGHMVIKLFIVLFIFWAGVQFGELKATVENYYGGGMMGERGGAYYYAGLPTQGGMMSGSWGGTTGAVNVQMMRVSTTTVK